MLDSFVCKPRGISNVILFVASLALLQIECFGFLSTSLLFRSIDKQQQRWTHVNPSEVTSTLSYSALKRKWRRNEKLYLMVSELYMITVL